LLEYLLKLSKTSFPNPWSAFSMMKRIIIPFFASALILPISSMQQVHPWIIHGIIRYNDLDIIKSLIAENTLTINQMIPEEPNKFYPSLSLLHYAAALDNVEIIHFLLKNGAQINQQAVDYNTKSEIHGATPLHIAIIKSKFKAIETLIDKEAIVTIKNFSGQTPLQIAECKKINITRFLSKKQKAAIDYEQKK
jgi:hypothetical protein